MTTTEIRQMLKEDSDFIALKRFDHSLVKLLDRYPDGCPDHVIANALMISEEEVTDLYNQIVEKLRVLMGV